MNRSNNGDGVTAHRTPNPSEPALGPAGASTARNGRATARTACLAPTSPATADAGPNAARTASSTNCDRDRPAHAKSTRPNNSTGNRTDTLSLFAISPPFDL